VQYPAVPGAYPDPPAVPGAQSDPPAVHVSGNDNSSTAVPIGGTNGELPSDTAREETQPSRAESARNPDSASADVTHGKPLRYTAFTPCKGFCSFCTDDNLCIVGMELAHEWKTIFWATELLHRTQKVASIPPPPPPLPPAPPSPNVLTLNHDTHFIIS